MEKTKRHKWEHKSKAERICTVCGIRVFKEIYGYLHYECWTTTDGKDGSTIDEKLPKCKD